MFYISCIQGTTFSFLPHVALAWAITASSSTKRNLFQNTNLETRAVEKQHLPSSVKNKKLKTTSEVNDKKLLQERGS